LLYTKILEGLQQKLEGLEPLSPIAGAATGRYERMDDCLSSISSQWTDDWLQLAYLAAHSEKHKITFLRVRQVACLQ